MCTVCVVCTVEILFATSHSSYASLNVLCDLDSISKKQSDFAFYLTRSLLSRGRMCSLRFDVHVYGSFVVIYARSDRHIPSLCLFHCKLNIAITAVHCLVEEVKPFDTIVHYCTRRLSGQH